MIFRPRYATGAVSQGRTTIRQLAPGLREVACGADHGPLACRSPEPKTDRRRERGERRRVAVLDAARDLFLRQGYRAPTLEALILYLQQQNMIARAMAPEELFVLPG